MKLAGYLTARTLMRTVPAAVPGIMFLSGELLQFALGGQTVPDLLVSMGTLFGGEISSGGYVCLL